MNAQDSARIALGGFVIFFLLAFGLRSLLQYRRTGSTGFVGISGRPGSAEWYGGVLFVLALVAAFAAPLAQLGGWLTPSHGFDRLVLSSAGVALYFFGAVGTLWAQIAMGDSWRIGVDAGAHTSLVAAGPFRWVRNPIFTAMLMATLGLALLVPNALSLVAVAALIVALQIQVRLVEEPYLVRAHGSKYLDYAARTGRFVPALGCLSTDQAA